MLSVGEPRTSFSFFTIDRADPVAIDAIRLQIWDLLTWARRDHADPMSAFGDLALSLAGKARRSDWTDADLDTVRTRLVTIKSLIAHLPAKLDPLTVAEQEFLRILTLVLGGDALGNDPLDAATRAGIGWYGGLSSYAKRTTSLPQEAELFREALRELGQSSARPLLLQMIPQRLGLATDLLQLPASDALNRVGQRLQETVACIDSACITVDETVAEVVRSAFKLPNGTLESILSAARVVVETKLASVGAVTIPQDVQRFVTVIRRDESASAVFQVLGRIYVGQKEATRWSDGDVALAQDEIRRVAQAVTNLTEERKSQKIRIALTMNGDQLAVDMQYHASIENAAATLEGQILQAVETSKARDESKMLAVAKVLHRMLSKQRRR